MNKNKQNKTEYSPQNFESLEYSLFDDNGNILLDNSYDPDLNLFSENIKNNIFVAWQVTQLSR